MTVTPLNGADNRITGEHAPLIARPSQASLTQDPTDVATAVEAATAALAALRVHPADAAADKAADEAADKVADKDRAADDHAGHDRAVGDLRGVHAVHDAITPPAGDGCGVGAVRAVETGAAAGAARVEHDVGAVADVRAVGAGHGAGGVAAEGGASAAHAQAAAAVKGGWGTGAAQHSMHPEAAMGVQTTATAEDSNVRTSTCHDPANHNPVTSSTITPNAIYPSSVKPNSMKPNSMNPSTINPKVVSVESSIHGPITPPRLSSPDAAACRLVTPDLVGAVQVMTPHLTSPQVSTSAASVSEATIPNLRPPSSATLHPGNISNLVHPYPDLPHPVNSNSTCPDPAITNSASPDPTIPGPAMMSPAIANPTIANPAIANSKVIRPSTSDSNSTACAISNPPELRGPLNPTGALSTNTNPSMLSPSITDPTTANPPQWQGILNPTAANPTTTNPSTPSPGTAHPRTPSASQPPAPGGPSIAVGGVASALQSLRETIGWPHQYPELISTLGVQVPMGVLLYGPPGCGKTLLVKSVAQEFGAVVERVSAASVYGAYLGESESRLRDAFARAGKAAEETGRPVVVFMDEVDALCPRRNNRQAHESRVVAQLLTLLDGAASRTPGASSGGLNSGGGPNSNRGSSSCHGAYSSAGPNSSREEISGGQACGGVGLTGSRGAIRDGPVYSGGAHRGGTNSSSGSSSGNSSTENSSTGVSSMAVDNGTSADVSRNVQSGMGGIDSGPVNFDGGVEGSVGDINSGLANCSESTKNGKRENGSGWGNLSGCMKRGGGRVVVIAATNRPNALDPALRRPGRLDREVAVGVPDAPEREEILRLHTRGLQLDADVDLVSIASTCHGYVGADLAALAREAAMHAVSAHALHLLDSYQGDLCNAPLPPAVVRGEDFVAAMKRVGPSVVRGYQVQAAPVQWHEVGGLAEVKQRLKQAVEWPLRHQDAFARLGIAPAKGVLLYGPPGCAKTTLIRAAATASGATLLPLSCAELFSMYVGEGEGLLREAFNRARLAAPSIVFLDELDAVAAKRQGADTNGGQGGAGGRAGLLSTLLTEMDGMEQATGVLVLGATNRPEALDTAVVRPGRFDTLIYVPPPDVDGRLEVLKLHTKGTPLAEDVDLRAVAEDTRMFTGAELAALCSEAALAALREDLLGASRVAARHFRAARLIVKPGLTAGMLEHYQKWGQQNRR